MLIFSRIFLNKEQVKTEIKHLRNNLVKMIKPSRLPMSSNKKLINLTIADPNLNK